jgi:predicted RNA-binding protein with PUA-like domain
MIGAMRYWLLKTEPSDYSFDDLENEPSGTVWDGVKNYGALKYLRDMEKGDRALVYHTGSQRRVVGIAEVTSNPYPDPDEDDAKIQVVDVKAGRRLDRTVSLADLKAEPVFEGHPLVKQPRLSVMELGPDQWERVLELGQGASPH